MTSTKNPYDTVFWNDLEGDERLKTCSLAAKGLWTCHLLPAAARSVERGVVIIGNWPCRVAGDLPTVLANSVGGSPDVMSVLLDELISSGAASVDDQGRIYNRRMVNARRLSEIRSKAGKTGADARWQTDGKHHGKTGGKRKTRSRTVSHGKREGISAKSANGGCEPDSKPMHSSSFGASYEKKILDTDQVEMFTAPQGCGADERGEPESGSGAGSRRARAVARGTRIPDGWQPSPEAEQFARDLDLDPKAVTDEFVDYWRGVTGQQGVKLDWNATFRNRCRQLAERRKPNGSQSARHNTNGRAAQSGEPTIADGVAAAFARRSLPT